MILVLLRHLKILLVEMTRFNIILTIVLFYFGRVVECASISTKAENEELFPLAIIHINDFHARYLFKQRFEYFVKINQ